MYPNKKMQQSLLNCYLFALLLFFDFCMKRYMTIDGSYEMVFHALITAFVVVNASVFYFARDKKNISLLRMALFCHCLYCMGAACLILPLIPGLLGMYIYGPWDITGLYFRLGFPAVIVFIILIFRLILRTIHEMGQE
jgi:hypothetical protein